MNYAELLRQKNLEAEQLNQQAEKLKAAIKLLQELQHLEESGEETSSLEDHSGDPKAKRRGRPKKNSVSISLEGAPKRGRGRPRRSPVAIAVVEDAPKRGRGRPRKVVEDQEPQEKSKKLPSLIQEIATEKGIPLDINEFVEEVKNSGYQNNSSNLGSMVYQCLRKLVNKGILESVTEDDKRKYVLA